VAVVLTLVQIRINIHKRNNTKNRVQTIQNTYYQNTHTLQNPHLHLVHILQNQLKQTQYEIYPNEIVTIQSSTLSMSGAGWRSG
jgi:hypothetical protein